MIKEIIEFAGGYRLKNMKSFETFDGFAWSATLYHDGRKLGPVGDDGRGGSMHMHIGTEDRQALTEHAKKKVDPEFEPAEMFLGILGDYTESIKRMKRQAKTAVLVIKEDEFDGQGVPSSYTRFKCEPTDKNIAAIKVKFPSYRLLADEIDLWK